MGDGRHRAKEERIECTSRPAGGSYSLWTSCPTAKLFCAGCKTLETKYKTNTTLYLVREAGSAGSTLALVVRVFAPAIVRAISIGVVDVLEVNLILQRCSG